MAECELGIDPLLDRCQPKLLEALHLESSERLELEIGERPPFPQAVGRAQRLHRQGGITRGEQLPRLRHEALEALEVELTTLDAQQVSGRACNETRLVAGRHAEHLPQPRDLVAQGVVGRVLRQLGEELADQTLARDDTIGAQEEQRQQCPLLRPPDRHEGSVHSNRKRTQDPELQAPRGHQTLRSLLLL